MFVVFLREISESPSRSPSSFGLVREICKWIGCCDFFKERSCKAWVGVRPAAKRLVFCAGLDPEKRPDGLEPVVVKRLKGPRVGVGEVRV